MTKRTKAELIKENDKLRQQLIDKEEKIKKHESPQLYMYDKKIEDYNG